MLREKWKPVALETVYSPQGRAFECPVPRPTLRVGINGPGKRPTRGTNAAAGWDVYSNEDVRLMPNIPTLVDTGLRMVLPEDWMYKIRDRSGMAFKHNIQVRAGIIDSDYRNFSKVLMLLTGSESTVNGYMISKGDKIAQILFQQVPDIDWQDLYDSEFAEFNTERGLNGFGSTGT